MTTPTEGHCPVDWQSERLAAAPDTRQSRMSTHAARQLGPAGTVARAVRVPRAAGVRHANLARKLQVQAHGPRSSLAAAHVDPALCFPPSRPPRPHGLDSQRARELSVRADRGGAQVPSFELCLP